MSFVSRAQQAAVMAKLKQEGFKRKPIKISGEGKYYRVRMLNPNKFQKNSFRTLGKEGHTKIIIARQKGMATTKTQAVLIPKNIRRM